MSEGANGAAAALAVRVLAGRYALCRLDAAAPLPAWAFAGEVAGALRTPDELSIVAAESAVPPEVRAGRGFRILALAGPFALDVVGVLARLSAAFAGAGVAVFALSTFDTDYFLVAETQLSDAVAALRAAGVAITE